MRVDEMRFFIDFDAWAMGCILATAEALSPVEFATAGGPGHAEPRSTLLHCINGVRIWRARLAGATIPAPATPDEYPTLAAVRGLCQTEQSLLEEYVAALTENDLAEVLDQSRPDRVLRTERWHLLVHLALHNMQHRSELAQALTLLGHSPGEIGLTAYLQQPGRTSVPG